MKKALMGGKWGRGQNYSSLAIIRYSAPLLYVMPRGRIFKGSTEIFCAHFGRFFAPNENISTPLNNKIGP